MAFEEIAASSVRNVELGSLTPLTDETGGETADAVEGGDDESYYEEENYAAHDVKPTELGIGLFRHFDQRTHHVEQRARARPVVRDLDAQLLRPLVIDPRAERPTDPQLLAERQLQRARSSRPAWCGSRRARATRRPSARRARCTRGAVHPAPTGPWPVPAAVRNGPATRRAGRGARPSW